MPRLGTYLLARVVKIGDADHHRIASTILNPEIVTFGKTKWTILNGQDYLSSDGKPYFYGKLAKFHPDADVTVANVIKKIEENHPEPNLIAARSPFVYLPSYSGIAFLLVSNHILKDHFFKVFPKVYTQTINELLNAIELESISDLRTFYAKLLALEKISSIQAKVYPPNPLFGILWKPLRDFLESRNSSSLDVNENGKDSGLKSDLPVLVESIINDSIDTSNTSNLSASFTDAAMLMAADGYGYGTVVGVENGKVVPVSTKDTTRSFKQVSDAEPEILFNIAEALFKKIEEERHMEHPNG